MIASNKESSGKDTFPACCQRTVLAVKSPTLTISAKKRERERYYSKPLRHWNERKADI